MTILQQRVSLFHPVIFGLLLCISGAYLARARVIDDIDSSVSRNIKLLLTNVVELSYKTSFECPSDGFYPVGECDPYYYVCLSGVVYPAVCPGNGVFDPESSNCVEYGSSSCATTTAFTGSTPPEPIRCGEDGFYAFGDCLESYYLCVDGVAYFERCPPGLVFVESLQTCKTPSEAGCPETTSAASSTTTPEIITTPTTSQTTTNGLTTSTQATCQEPDGIYAYGPCQHNYYSCVGGTLANQVCPNDWVFDELVATCVPEADCGASTTTLAPGATFQCPDNEIGFYPLAPGACSPYYYTCYQGEAYPQKCPTGSLFDENHSDCDLEENVSCNQKTL